MIESELKKYLETIIKDTSAIARRQGAWKSFLYGILGGLGSIVGAAAGLIAIGYILNMIGVIPALKAESEKWRQTLEMNTTKQIPGIQQGK